MKERWIVFRWAALGLVLGLMLAIIPGHAQEPGERDERIEPAGELSIEAVVSSKISYQGRLSESGIPVNGRRDMAFRIFTDSACSVATGALYSIPGLEINNGLFAVEIPAASNIFTGKGLWLEISVGGISVGCQEILPVPYALSLRPGANIMGEITSWDALHVENWATSGFSYGVYALSRSVDGRGVMAYASSTTGTNYGLFARTDSKLGAAVYARGVDDGADLILAGNADTLLGDDGRISSDPAYPSSDIHILSNDGVRIDLDQNNDGEDADFEVRNAADALIFNIDESGDVTFGGGGVAAFPKPAYDSGWRAISPGGTLTLTHNQGRDADNYVVDLACNHPTYGRHIWGLGGDVNSPDSYGVYWRSLTTSTIAVKRGAQDGECPEIRVRIWMYP
jgi:hypothetical protein